MRLLFVCTGNTCRSPMAQGLARKYLPEGIEIASAGIQAFDGDKASDYAVMALKKIGSDISEHRSVRVTKSMLESADYVLTMTKNQEKMLTSLYPEYINRIMSLGSFIGSDKEISDPWGGSADHYSQCALEIEELIKAIAEKVNKLSNESRG